MTADFHHALIMLLTLDTLDEVTGQALDLFRQIVCPDEALLLLWDDALDRHIIGAVWTADAQTSLPALRRQVLRLADAAQRADAQQARALADGWQYLPLAAADVYVGALLAVGVNVDNVDPVINPSLALLRRGAAKALYTTQRLQQAQREHDQLTADGERLRQLLRAVEEQQRTIDRLLAAEREFSAGLEAQVEARTAALRTAQDRLIQSEKLAVIGQLASSLAHELNNPLQAIHSGLELVLTEVEGEAVRGDLTIILAELERIESLFRQMLDFYRPVTEVRAPLDLNAICEGVRVLMRKRLEQGQVALRLKLTEPLPLTCGDGNQIKQVLLNLLLNAAEALPASGGQIVLRTACGADVVCISVSDDGVGISPEHQARLFEPLFTTKTRGLGLGLAISQEIAQRHGGGIVVESRPGRGTTFTLRLPIEDRCRSEAG